MKNASEIRKITENYKKTANEHLDNYITNLCENNLIKAIEHKASRGGTQCEFAFKEKHIASAVAMRFRQLDFEVKETETDQYYGHTNLVTIIW